MVRACCVVLSLAPVCLARFRVRCCFGGALRLGVSLVTHVTELLLERLIASSLQLVHVLFEDVLLPRVLDTQHSTQINYAVA